MTDHLQGFGITIVYVAMGTVLGLVGAGERRMHATLWMIGLYLFGAHSLIGAMTHGSAAPGNGLLAWIPLTAGCAAVAVGVQVFLRRPVPWTALGLAAATAVGFALAALAGVSPSSLRAPVYSAIGVGFLLAGRGLVRWGPVGSGRIVSGGGLMVGGVYAFTYPWLRQLGWWTSLEFYVDLALTVGTTSGVALMHFEAARAEAEAHARRYRSLFESAPVGLFRLDAGGRLIAANPTLLALIGRTEAEAHDLSLLHDLIADDTLRARVSACLDADVEFRGELRWRRPRTLEASGVEAGTLQGVPRGEPNPEVQVSVILRPTRDEHDGVVIEGSAQDITEEHRLREQLQQKARMEALGRLAGGIAHDFNNVLTVVINGTELALRRMPPELALVRAPLDAALEAAQGATALTRQLLAFGRHQAGAAVPLELNAVVRSAVRMLDPVLGASIRVTTRTGTRSLPVVAQPGQLEQVLMNLALNARDAMPGGGSLDIDAGLHTDPHGVERVRLIVSDNGHGMDDHTRQRVFEPFFTTKDASSGTGLGLAMVYAMVSQLGGTITVTSAPDVGTQFTVLLPLAPSPLPLESPPSNRTQNARGATVLLVEDRETVLRATALTLEDLGYRVVQARNAAEALECARHSGVDVLLTDVAMPEQTGPELARQLRSSCPSLPVVFISGNADTQHGLDPVPNAVFLPKPFGTEELADTVARALELGSPERPRNASSFS